MKIAISGLSGSGVTTVCRKIAEALDLKIGNYTMRTLAEELGEPFERVQARAEKDRKMDYLIDSRQMESGERSNVIIGSRLACWLVDADLFVWLEADAETRARRIFEREGGDYRRILAFTRKRDKLNIARYRKLYKVDVLDNGWVDLKINVRDMDADAVCATIAAAARARAGKLTPRRNPHKARMKTLISSALGKARGRR